MSQANTPQRGMERALTSLARRVAKLEAQRRGGRTRVVAAPTPGGTTGVFMLGDVRLTTRRGDNGELILQAQNTLTNGPTVTIATLR